VSATEHESHPLKIILGSAGWREEMRDNRRYERKENAYREHKPGSISRPSMIVQVT
jgi:hypothetical protein